ncbi:MAG: O-antigen ligase family protein [Clostridia bacterium]|nr:O-antigen ligase family protein [Clostridia bacterium]
MDQIRRRKIPLAVEDEYVYFENAKGKAFKDKGKFLEIREWAEDFFPSTKGIVFMSVIGALFVAFNLTIPGIFVEFLFASFALIFCEDILATTLPFLLGMMIASEYYNNLRVYLPYWWIPAMLLVCLVAHLIIYAKPIRFGKNGLGLVLVTFACALSGLGCMTFEEYTQPMSLYYQFSIGLGMLLVYLIVKAQMVDKGKYRPFEKLMRTFYAYGLFNVFIVLNFTVKHWDLYRQGFTATDFPFKNYCATMLLLVMSVPVYYVIKKSHWHLISIGVMLLGILFTGSRGAFLFGGIIVLAQIVVIFKYNIEYRKIYKKILIASILPLAVVGYFAIHFFFGLRIQFRGNMFYIQPSRIQFLTTAWKDFIDNPVFGIGLGNRKNFEIFPYAVDGSMVFYHNYVMQILGSLGSLGIVSYGIMLYERFATIKKKINVETIALILGYFAILLMSMTNPGEFTAIPYEMLVVIIFVVLESYKKELI